MEEETKQWIAGVAGVVILGLGSLGIGVYGYGEKAEDYLKKTEIIGENLNEEDFFKYLELQKIADDPSSVVE